MTKLVRLEKRELFSCFKFI